jgi:hypothetical protein
MFIHSTGSEINALHKGTSNTFLLHSFLASIGFHPQPPPPSMKIIKGPLNSCTPHIYAVKIAWLNDQFSLNHLHTVLPKKNNPKIG